MLTISRFRIGGEEKEEVCVLYLVVLVTEQREEGCLEVAHTVELGCSVRSHQVFVTEPQVTLDMVICEIATRTVILLQS